jgi:hypothetical protein
MKKFSIFGLIALFALISCDKKSEVLENTNKPTVQNAPKHIGVNVSVIDGMLVFDSIGDFFRATREIHNMDEEQRREWETSIGFSSFGRMADNFYNVIDFNNYHSFKDMIDSFKESPFIDVMVDDNVKDTTYLPKDFDMPERYVMNQQRLYVINKNVYKHFSDETLVITMFSEANAANINLLSKATDYSQFDNNTNFTVTSAIAFSAAPSNAPSNSVSVTKKEFINYAGEDPYKIGKSFRSRIIVKATIRKVAQDGGAKFYCNRFTYTVINEKYDRWWLIWWHYWWNNTAYKVNGSMKFFTNCEYQHPNVGQINDATFTPEIIFINNNIAKGTHYMETQYAYYSVPHITPSFYFTGWNINLSVSNGVTMNY